MLKRQFSAFYGGSACLQKRGFGVARAGKNSASGGACRQKRGFGAVRAGNNAAFRVVRAGKNAPSG